MNGRIVDIVRTFEGRFRVSFDVESIDELNGMEGNLSISVKKNSGRRSLSANAYFHVLVGKIAEALHISKARAKNTLLGRYGQREINDAGQVIISVLSDIDMMEREDIHCVPVGYGTVNGKEFTHYCVLRPTHEYDSLEMSVLIDGTVEEAKELGIPTLSPDEIKHMESLWKGAKCQ